MYKEISKVSGLKVTEKLQKALKGHDLQIEYDAKGKRLMGAMPGIEKVNNPMELDTGRTIARVRGMLDGVRFDARVRVSGPVRVVFRNEVFCSASEMPADLLKAYHDGTDPMEAVTADGNEYKAPYFCDQSNGFEKSIRLTAENGDVLAAWKEEIDAPEDKSGTGYVNMLLEDVIRLKETLK